MAYLYHVTTEENAKSILKNGLIPKIGERSQLVGETEKYVYLCGRKDVPFWSLILDKPVVLRVEMKDGEVNENNVYQYSYYSETLAETAIPAERIRKSRVSRSLTDEQMKDLALSYVDMISLICVKFAEYITYIDDEPEEEAAEDRQAIELTIEALKFTLPHLNFSGVNAKMLRDHLHERGDGGCTLCDRYEPNWEEGGKCIRLYDQGEKKFLYAFSRCICTFASARESTSFKNGYAFLYIAGVFRSIFFVASYSRILSFNI